MSKWFSGFRRDATRAGAIEAPLETTVLELCVIEGLDAGQQFTVDGALVRIGRGVPQTAQAGAVLLHDTSVSSEQATIRTSPKGAMLEHNPLATNPTLVNGREVRAPHALKLADRIQMGRVVLEVRERKGVGLSDFARTGSQPRVDPAEVAGETEARTPVDQGPADEDVTRIREMPPGAEALTVIRANPMPTGTLTVVYGFDEMEGESFDVSSEKTVVGRSAQCDITLPEPGVSRQHCCLEWRDRDLVLVHLSATNATSVNGVPVTSEYSLSSGDEILLADQVAVRVEFETFKLPMDRTTLPIEREQTSLRQYMEERVEQDRRIEEEFRVRGSFLDVDVVGSYAMKTGELERPANIIVSFERFRSYVERTINEFDGQVLNSNGDELMCFFDSTEAAVRSACAILSRLDDFNAEENVLNSPFRFRIGVHTGTSLVDRARGVAYSPVLDIAGHLQKNADVNGLLISEATMQALPEGLPFESAGPLEREKIETYRLNGTL